MIKTSKKVKVNHAINYRNYRRARDRALSRLANAYPETYKELLEQEKVNDETTGGTWAAIDNDATITVDVRSSSGNTGVSAHSDRGSDQSNEGTEA